LLFFALFVVFSSFYREQTSGYSLSFLTFFWVLVSGPLRWPVGPYGDQWAPFSEDFASGSNP